MKFKEISRRIPGDFKIFPGGVKTLKWNVRSILIKLIINFLNSKSLNTIIIHQNTFFCEILTKFSYSTLNYNDSKTGGCQSLSTFMPLNYVSCYVMLCFKPLPWLSIADFLILPISNLHLQILQKADLSSPSTLFNHFLKRSIWSHSGLILL